MRNTPPAWNDETTWPGTTPPQPQPQPQPVRPPVARSTSPYRPPRNGTLTVSRLSGAIGQLIALALGIVEMLLIVRIVLLLLAANPDATFSSLIFGWTAPLVAPFQGVFPNAVGGQGAVIDVAAILAMVVYALLARVVEAAVRILTRFS